MLRRVSNNRQQNQTDEFPADTARFYEPINRIDEPFRRHRDELQTTEPVNFVLKCGEGGQGEERK